MFYIIQTAFELGFLYAFVAMALFLSYRILDIADLTTDGSFILGAAVSVTMTAAGHPILGLFVACVAGACAGGITAFLQTKMGVPAILSGIITNTGLYTVNLMVMGWKSNVSLLKKETVFSMIQKIGKIGEYGDIFFVGSITVVIGIMLYLFLKTRLGLSIRATGNNITMVRASSINPTFTIMVGLCLANAMTALSGAMVGQYQNAADINGGTGIVVIGLACLIIGETILGKKSVIKGILAAILGSLIYRIIYAMVLYTKIVPVQGLKLITAIVVAIAISFPTIKKQMEFQKKKYLALRKRGE